ncbi:MetQ/NlpA family ABC transporter substrate-binding protein [Aerococcaceae bacterium 50-4]
MNNKLKLSATIFASIIALAACGTSGNESGSTSEEQAEYTVGVVGDTERLVWEDVAERVADEGITLNVETFTDYVAPNTALVDGSLDLNAFQHLAFLAEFVEANDADLQPIGYTYISPMGAYSETIENIDDLTDGGSVVIPNDVTNGGRALLLLELAGVIEVDDAAGITPSLNDITENPKNLEITEVDAAQVPRSLADADLVVANTNYAVDAGLVPEEDAIFLDTDDLSSLGAQYKNAAVIRPEDAENEDIQTIIDAYQSDETAAKIDEVTSGADQPAWTDADDIQADFDEVVSQSEPAE